MRKPTRRPAFEDACRTVARNLSENGTKVRVVFQGDGASTNGTTIYLPMGDQLSVMEPKECGVLAGYVDHEAEHIASTDMELWNETIGVANSFRRELCNAIEDMRIEKIAVRKNPGSYANLSDTTENVCERELKELRELKDLMPDKLESKRFILPGAVTWEGRKRAGMHAHLQEALLALCSEEIRDMAKRINDELMSAREGREGTHDVWALANKYADEVEEEEDAKDAGADGQNESTQPAKDGGDEQDGERSDDNDDDGDKDGDDGNDDTKDGDARSQGDGDEDNDEPEDERSGEENGGEEAVEQQDDGEENEVGGRGASLEVDNGKERGETRAVKFVPVVNTPSTTSDRWIPYTTEYDLWVTADSGPVYYHDGSSQQHFWYQEKIFAASNVEVYDNLLREMGPHLHTMRAKLRRALLSKLDRRWEGGYTGGRLDARRLVDAVRGVPEVFRQREAEQFMDTAVQIVIDLSGSMAIKDSSLVSRITLAAQTAIAIANALEGTGVEYEIIGFQEPGLVVPTKEAYDDVYGQIITHRQMTPTFSRWLPNMMVEFKPFGRRLRDCRAALGGIKASVGGANNDVDAIVSAHTRLARRSETRKVMVVLSDGKPACYTEFDTDYVERMLRKTVAQIENTKHIQIVGIGIDSDCVSKFYKHYSVLKKADDLPRTVIDQVAKMLLGSRFQVDNAALLGAA